MTQQVKAGVSEGLVHRLRDAYRLTQKDAALLLSVHPMSVSKLENHRATLSRELRNKVLILLDVSLIPGAVDSIRYVLKAQGGDEACWLALSLSKVGP